MAITNAQQYKQLVNPPMKGNKRPGYRGGDAYGGGSYAGGQRSGGERGDGAGSIDRVAAATNIGSMQQAFGPSIGPETKGQQENIDRIAAQRRRARYAITPSTNPRNRILSGIASAFVPGGGFLFNKAVDRTAMGFNQPTIIDDDEDDLNKGRDENNFRETIITQQFSPYQQDVIEDAVEELSPTELALQQRGEARAFAKEGGIMDLETGRQMYFLGKLVKKAKRAVKKIVKSPVGKTALAAAGIFKLGGGSFGNLFKRGIESGFQFSNITGASFLSDLDNKQKFGLAAAAGLTAAPFLFQEDDTEDEYQKFLSQRGASGK